MMDFLSDLISLLNAGLFAFGGWYFLAVEGSPVLRITAYGQLAVAAVLVASVVLNLAAGTAWLLLNLVLFTALAIRTRALLSDGKGKK